MKKYILVIICSVFILAMFCPKVYAAGLLDDIINQAGNFKGSEQAIGTRISSFISDDIIPIVGTIGNLIFAAVTVILGAKYIWSSAEGKAQVLETLPGFVIAVVFFYLGENLLNWLTGIGGTITSAKDWNNMAEQIIWIINTLVHYSAFAGIIVLGLRYMFASAEGKSRLKTSLGALVIGLMFVFSASKVVDFIIKIGDEII